MDTQDVDVTTSPEEEDRRWGAGVLPWVVLAIVALIVLWLLRGFVTTEATPGELTSQTTTVNVTDLVKPTGTPEAYTPSTETTESSRVPDVVGLFENEAQDTLESEGFEMSATSVYSTSEPVGMVFDQVPGAYEEAEPGSVVAVLVSVGPAPTATVVVPDMVGLKIEAAKDKAKARGLDPKLMIQPIDESPGRIYQQSPKAGERVREGSKVFILAGEAPGY